MATQMSQTPAVSGGVASCVRANAFLPPDGHYHTCSSARPVCPHVSEFHYYLTMANKQFAPLDGVMNYILTRG